MSAIPFVHVNIMRPSAREISIASNDEQCGLVAREVAARSDQVLRVNPPLQTHISWPENPSQETTGFKVEYEAELKAGVDANDFIKQLRAKIQQTLKERGLRCDVLHYEE